MGFTQVWKVSRAANFLCVPIFRGEQIVREQQNLHLIGQVEKARNIFGKSMVQKLIRQTSFCGRPDGRTQENEVLDKELSRIAQHGEPMREMKGSGR